MKTQLPESFLQQIKKEVANEMDAFLSILKGESPTSIRYNKYKKKTNQENLNKVKWNSEGVYLDKRPSFTLDPSFHAGAYYVQEASSMFVSEALRQNINLNNPLTVLDLCAAPGGKSTLLMSQISSDSLLLSNEVIKARYKVLKENMMKWGAPNYAVCNHDPNEFHGLEGFFDVLLIDAPCSGEGLFRKDKNAIKEWSPELVQLCSARQKRIFSNSLALLKKGGTLIYCTCTYNEFENSQNVAWLTQNFPVNSIQLKLDAKWGISEKEHQSNFSYQFYPHKVKGEGFFISVFKKTDGHFFNTQKKKGKKAKNEFRSLKKLTSNKVTLLEKWINKPHDFAFYETPNEQILAFPKSLLASYLILDKVLKRKQFGIPIGTFKRNDFIPTHDLALSNIIHPNLPFIEVNKQQALLFLKKENPSLNIQLKGWQLIRYQGLNIGWIKAVPGRINNYLPKEFRIRMAIK